MDRMTGSMVNNEKSCSILSSEDRLRSKRCGKDRRWRSDCFLIVPAAPCLFDLEKDRQPTGQRKWGIGSVIGGDETSPQDPWCKRISSKQKQPERSLVKQRGTKHNKVIANVLDAKFVAGLANSNELFLRRFEELATAEKNLGHQE
ncbi:hypothetical protein M422DRAFT_785040 [Sphaerobolus stellatus SS14]|uniref:Unplaced genomic scaffold SPHSTscaffold_273, whole genome shotgun sequence n=1 Tax=Sphaerobolus stellatus (strain SS14) TaxID=990650 RepID=A0A0C9UNI2_SPHS4|nr:hypothetical protein M422DRAFT_785040 [Sphaerobolus stellatus SS14]